MAETEQRFDRLLFGSVDEILEGELCQLLSDQGSNPYFLLVSEDIAVASDEHLGIEISEE